MAIPPGKLVCIQDPVLLRASLALLTTIGGNNFSIETYKDTRIWITIRELATGQSGATVPSLLVCPMASGGNGVEGKPPIPLAREWMNFTGLDHLQHVHWYAAIALPLERFYIYTHCSKEVTMQAETVLWENTFIPCLKNWNEDRTGLVVANSNKMLEALAL